MDKVNAAELQVLRVWHTLRTFHFEFLASALPGTTIYRKASYDFEVPRDYPHAVRKRSMLGAALEVYRSKSRYIEINEPLYLAAWPQLLLLRAAAALRSSVRGGSIVIGYYALENSDIAQSLRNKFRLNNEQSVTILNLATKLLVWRNDRVVFGTEAARDSYRKILGRRLPQDNITIPQLPSPCVCGECTRNPCSVLFVGALDERKGILCLLDAWSGILEVKPDAALTIIGSEGDKADEVQEVVASIPNVHLIKSPRRSEVHKALRTASVLVLLSQRDRYWREQVGLPILEGLAHGTEVVCTEETGLATWLRDNRHRVLPVSARTPLIVDAVTGALESERSAVDIRATLPLRHGRLAADDWLYADCQHASQD